MNFLRQAEDLKDYMVALRRCFHARPELSWKEYETGKKIKAELDKLGIPHHNVAGTGVVGIIEGPAGAPFIGLRADMDALPVQEKSEAPYASLNDGVMHACGHDAHMAILLGTAHMLTQCGHKLKVGVKLIFQPAEEAVAGAAKVLEDPLVQNLANVGALHVWSGLDAGNISVLPGARMASADTFKLRIEGAGAHASMPHLGVDALYVASMVENALQYIVARRCDPLQPAVVTIGTLRAGTANNILASSAEMSGTVRTFDAALRAEMPGMIEHIAVNIAKAFGAKAGFERIAGTPPMVNDAKSAEVAQGVAAGVVGGGHVVFLERTTGGEDFACFLEKSPGMLAFIGARNDAEHKNFAHHHERFDIDETALVNGAAFLAGYALKIQDTL
jgi:amidohydrolase